MIDTLARELWEREKWGKLLDTTNDSMWAKNAKLVRRKMWDDLPEESSDGPCNCDCFCNHHFHGKKEMRELAEFVISRLRDRP
jgi:hypothetical protein